MKNLIKSVQDYYTTSNIIIHHRQEESKPCNEWMAGLGFLSKEYEPKSLPTAPGQREVSS